MTALQEWQGAGLNASSGVKAQIATLENRDLLRSIGRRPDSLDPRSALDHSSGPGADAHDLISNQRHAPFPGDWVQQEHRQCTTSRNTEQGKISSCIHTDRRSEVDL